MKPAPKVIISFLSVIIIILIVWLIFPSHAPRINSAKKGNKKGFKAGGNRVTFVCPSGDNVPAAFRAKNVVSVRLESGKWVKLHRTRSADGGRYANQNESFVLWDKGIYALITHHDTTETCINREDLGQVKANKRKIKKVVTGFGSRLQRVSLLAPEASRVLARIYKPYVTPQLLSKWEHHLSSAPGRTTSSPWPDHFIINRIQPSGVVYTVNATLVLMTSNEIEHGGKFGTKEVEMTLAKRNGNWQIASYRVLSTSH